jgi:serine/threonine-protein kinase
LSLDLQTGSSLPGAAPGSPFRFGKYTLLAKLAQGGMGEIFAALLSGEAGFEKLVVIKRILPHLAEDPRFISMFLTEGRVTASLTHPNICQVFELGQIDGEYYLAMEYLEGVSLARLIRQNMHRGLDLRIAAGILCQTLEGLEFAHSFRQPGGGMVGGIIHRDMSPSNVFVTSAGLVKVLDFGVAKVSQTSLSTATGLKGKYPYMAPEQIKGQDLDGRADLFSVGVLLHEVVTGRSLFHRGSDFETLMAVVNGDRPRASQLRADLPHMLEDVIDRSLEVAREDRYSTAREMSEALARALEPAKGAATSRELAEMVRRDCADDLEDERLRIHRATAYLKSLTDRGQEPPAFMNRRPRPVMALSSSSSLERADPAGLGSVAGRQLSVARAGEFALPPLYQAPARRRSGRNVVLFLVLAAAASAGAVGWWLRGSPDGLGLPDGLSLGDGLPAAASPGNVSAAERAAAPAGTEASPAAKAASAAEAGPAAEASPAAEAARHDAEAARHDAEAARHDAAGGERAGTDRAAAADRPAERGGAEVERGGAEAERPPSDAAARRRARRAANRRSERAAAPSEPGYFSVDALPYAQIYIDGDLAGITPLVRIPLKPGRHSVLAVAESGATERFTISVRPSETVSRRIRLELLKP